MGKIQLLSVIFGFVKHCINEKRLEESLFESPGRQAGVQLSSFSSSGRVYRAVQSSKADVRMMRSALFLCNKIFSFPNTAKQFIILHVTTCASHQKHNYFLTNATGNPNIHQHVRREKISTLQFPSLTFPHF